MALRYLRHNKFLVVLEKRNKPIQEIQIIKILGKFQNLTVEHLFDLNQDKVALKSIQIKEKEEL
jgi:hypothetical protein